MAITFDTLEYLNELKAADVPEAQALAQARALRRVLDTALSEHSADLATKADIALVRKEIAIARRDTIIWLGSMLIAGFGTVIMVLR